MLKRLIGFLSVVIAAAAIGIVGAGPAQADTFYCDPVTNKCYTIIENPGTDPISNPDPETGFTPGPTVCTYKKFVDGAYVNVETPCSDGKGGYWSNTRQCYWSLDDPQAAVPPGSDPAGAWYSCTPHPECGTGQLDRPCYGVGQFLPNPPPGIDRLTPGQAAARLIRTFQLQGVNIGFAPDPNTPGSVGYVGIPVWMWVNDPTPLTYGPYSQTATLGGQTITATATVRSILWNMGDGSTVACANPGTPYQVSFGLTDSPNCGHRYSNVSNGRYTVTATSQWTVDWTGGGQSGSVPLTATSNTSVEIRELQSVNVR